MLTSHGDAFPSCCLDEKSHQTQCKTDALCPHWSTSIARDLGDTIPLKIVMLTHLGKVWGENGAMKGSAGQNWSAADLEVTTRGQEEQGNSQKVQKIQKILCPAVLI